MNVYRSVIMKMAITAIYAISIFFFFFAVLIVRGAPKP
jgi:hypothetical protein